MINPGKGMEMKKSTTIMVGKVLVAGVWFATMTGCSVEPEYQEVEADNMEICVDQQTQERVEDRFCDDGGSSRYHHWYQSRAHGPAPAVGSRINPAYGTSVRPGGTIARPPATGGFGRTIVSVGG